MSQYLQYRNGATPRIGDRVTHYVDGDAGTVQRVERMRGAAKWFVTVDWDRDGLQDHFADELWPETPEPRTAGAKSKCPVACPGRKISASPLDNA